MRKFNEKAWKKHTTICKKVFLNKRKVFNMAEKRAEAIVEDNGEDALKLVKKNQGTKGNAKRENRDDRRISGSGKWAY
jgi:hypothetical protein